MSNGDVNSAPIRTASNEHYPSQLQTNSDHFINRTQNIGDGKEMKTCTTPKHTPYAPDKPINIE